MHTIEVPAPFVQAAIDARGALGTYFAPALETRVDEAHDVPGYTAQCFTLEVPTADLALLVVLADANLEERRGGRLAFALHLDAAAFLHVLETEVDVLAG